MWPQALLPRCMVNVRSWFHPYRSMRSLTTSRYANNFILQHARKACGYNRLVSACALDEVAVTTAFRIILPFRAASSVICLQQFSSPSSSGRRGGPTSTNPCSRGCLTHHGSFFVCTLTWRRLCSVQRDCQFHRLLTPSQSQLRVLRSTCAAQGPFLLEDLAHAQRSACECSVRLQPHRTVLCLRLLQCAVTTAPSRTHLCTTTVESMRAHM